MLGGALRRELLNTQLLRVAAGLFEARGASVDFTTLRDFELPLYDGDVEAASGVPAGAAALADRLTAADAYVIASPEYNGSVPGTLKNAVDWVSRLKPNRLNGTVGLLLSASPSAVGGNRALWVLRVSLEILGSFVHPEMFSLSLAHQAFDADGKLTRDDARKRLDGLIERFLDSATKLRAKG